VEENKISLSPFLKWAGGKRWFVQKHADLLPKSYNRYIEPFLGGGSVFFHLQPTHSILGDTNPDVISAYCGIKQDWKALVQSLQNHDRNHSDEYYYSIRSSKPRAIISRASRMLYLNRTCFNGIYRVNRQGEFNVPRGTKDAVLMESDKFEEISQLLKSADIRLVDFEVLIDEAESGDFIFADPPYTVRHNFNGFVKYNEKLFSWHDQERLAAALIRARGRGVQVLSTNANHSSVRELYNDKDFHLSITSRFSSISAAPKNRKQFEELIILSQPVANNHD
jgi:DNA adenine methylase